MMNLLIQIFLIIAIIVISQGGDAAMNYVRRKVSTQTYDLICKFILVYCVCVAILVLVWIAKLVVI